MANSINELTWDSSFFNSRIGCVVNIAALSDKDMHDYDLLTCKVSSNDRAKITKLDELGFQLVEGELVYLRHLTEDKNPNFELSRYTASTNDVTQLKSIAKSAFVESRYREPWFSHEQHQLFYQKWVENAVLKQFDDICLIDKVDGVLRGFVSARVIDRVCIIGLFAVAEQYRGHGVGSNLMRLLDCFAKSQYCTAVSVSTQLSNLAASNFYISRGFLLSSSNYWFYKGHS